MWIDLRRTFLHTDQPGEVPSPDAWRHALSAKFTWEDVLAQPCVVLLGEAGTGKTAELRAQAEHLTRHQQAGFFLGVEALAEDGLLDAVEGEIRRPRTMEARVGRGMVLYRLPGRSEAA